MQLSPIVLCHIRNSKGVKIFFNIHTYIDSSYTYVYFRLGARGFGKAQDEYTHVARKHGY